MERELTLRGDSARIGAAGDVARLMDDLRMDYALVGDIALRAWLDDEIGAEGTVDLLAVIQTERSGQIPKGAPARGFRVDPEEAERGEELDLLPMTWTGGERPVRVHVLFATNALYARMVREGVAAAAAEAPVKVIAAEDLALLLLVGDSPESGGAIARLRLKLGDRFDLEGLNRKLLSIGLGGRVLS